MKKYLVMYMAPATVIDEWKKTDPAKREEAEKKMSADWQEWMKEHKEHFADFGAGAGKTMRVTSEGVEPMRNDIMLYAIVQSDSHDEAAELFHDHPHLSIPQSWIEVMELNPLPGMKE